VDQFITTGLLANEANEAAETIRRKCDSGEVPAIRTENGFRLIKRTDADRYLKRRAARSQELAR